MGRKIIIYTGSLLPGKGVQHLLEAILILCRQREDLFFVLVGYPVDKAWSFVKENGLAGHVLLVGRVAYGDLAGWLGVGDVAIEPKEDESGEASGKLLHYMAAGLAVACFDTANNRKFLDQSGYYAKEVSADALARAVAAALADTGEAKRRGERGRESIRQTYSMTGVGRNLLQVYQKLTGNLLSGQ